MLLYSTSKLLYEVYTKKDLQIEFHTTYISRRKKYKSTSTTYFSTSDLVNGTFTFIIEAMIEK